jgi:hypothetical protein
LINIVRGEIVAYRIFDIADEVDLGAIEEKIKATLGASRLAIARSTGHALVVRNAPLTLTLGSAQVRLGRENCRAELFARLWDYGAISIQFRIAVAEGTAWDELVALAAMAEDDNDFDELALRRTQDLTATLSGAMKSPHDPRGIEDYVVYLLEKIEGVSEPAELLTAVDVPALILGEPKEKISAAVRSAILGSAHSYSVRDLAVIDWNSALLVEPEGSRDVADILEFAVTHLMEFRAFDDLLDERLERLYDSIEHRPSVWSFFRNDYERLSREARALYIEFSDYVERVENSLKFVGDFYLATIFRSAVAKFNLREWEDSVSRKMSALARISEVVQGEINTRRSHWLEVIVVVLILVELLSTIVRLG